MSRKEKVPIAGLAEPLKLDASPVCRPQGMGGERIRNYLSQLGLCVSPVGIGHLAKTFCNPISVSKKSKRHNCSVSS